MSHVDARLPPHASARTFRHYGPGDAGLSDGSHHLRGSTGQLNVTFMVTMTDRRRLPEEKR